MQIVAFDYGEKKIGVAVGQTETNTSSPLQIIFNNNDQVNWNEISVLLDEWKPELIIIGKPLNMDGTDSEIMKKVEKFVKHLKTIYDAQYEYIDERLTTFEAKEILIENKSDIVDANAAKILIDKFPFQTVCLPLINLLFPDSKIIFTHRNPYDTVLSCFQQSFEPNNAMANFRSIESASRIYDLTMSFWLDYKEKLKLKYVTSKYEDLIEDFDQHILKILNFLDVSWDENIKNYRNTAHERGKINTPSSSQVVQPLYKSSIGKWKNYENYFKDSDQYLKKWISYFKY